MTEKHAPIRRKKLVVIDARPLTAARDAKRKTPPHMKPKLAHCPELPAVLAAS